MYKKIERIVILLILIILCAGCTKKNVDVYNELQISPFEIVAIQREYAKNNEAGYEVIDAGRGNPNWINALVRKAYSSFMNYAIYESEFKFNYNSVAGQAMEDGISDRFDQYYKDRNDEESNFVKDAIDYCVNDLKLDKEELLKELVDGIIGDYYPVPSRCLKNVEVILNKYLESTLYDGVKLSSETNIFPTEGGSAAMVYLFQSLRHNKVLNYGDKIAIATPIFSPYLEIPNINNYGLVSMRLETTPDNNWDISDEEIAKIEDKSVKAFFLVNPANPSSQALSKNALKKIKKAIEKNPDLLIITDDVYGTFVNGFQTVYSICPYNTILVYSYSKLYGVTGWRVGLVAMNEHNVVDKIISNHSKENKDFLDFEYKIVTDDVEKLPFVERLTADSRSVSLYHTSGLSTPQQVFMAIMSLSHLVDESNDKFINDINKIIEDRYDTLKDSLGLPKNEIIDNARYYVLIDFLDFVKRQKGEEFANKLKEAKNDLEVLNDLASKKGVVLMYGPGFGTKEWMMRISLANNDATKYKEMAERMKELLDDYMKILF